MPNPDDWDVFSYMGRLFLRHRDGRAITAGYLLTHPGQDLDVVWRDEVVAEDEVLPEAKEILLMYAFGEEDQSGLA